MCIYLSVSSHIYIYTDMHKHVCATCVSGGFQKVLGVAIHLNLHGILWWSLSERAASRLETQ